MGDKIADLTLKQAKELSDYLKEAHGIEPAAGGGAVMVAAGPADAGPAEEREDRIRRRIDWLRCDKKLNVVKVVKNLTGSDSLMEAKKMVEGVPATLKRRCCQGRSRQDQRRNRRSWRSRRAQVI